MTSSEEELGSIARQRIGSGDLPCDPSAHQMWGSRGTGKPCVLCGDPIQADDVEYEVAVAGSRGEHVLRFHIVCHSIWRAECGRLGDTEGAAHGLGQTAPS